MTRRANARRGAWRGGRQGSRRGVRRTAGRAALWTFAAVGAGATAQQVLRSPQWRLARQSGWSIAQPSAAGWVTDFLNAAYFARPPGLRDIDDLRLAYCVLTTRWHQLGDRPLRATDVAAFHRAFGAQRFVDARRSRRGTLDRDQVLDGAARLLGDWFPAAYHDDARRAWGIAFPSAADRDAYRPEARLRYAPLGPLSPPIAPGPEQTWNAYPPVEVADAEATAAALQRPETWPDYASEIGRFTPLRSGGLEGQSFEIEVTGRPTARTPVYLRAYVTATQVVRRDTPDTLAAYLDEVADGLARFGRDDAPVVPPGGETVLAVDLTTHEGHFLGNARSRLLVYEHDGRAWLRAVGTWDPLRWDLAQLYERVGYTAQHAMWGAGAPEHSMLHQVAAAVARSVARPGNSG